MLFTIRVSFHYYTIYTIPVKLSLIAGAIAAHTNDFWHADIRLLQERMLQFGALIRKPGGTTWFEESSQRVIAPLLCGEEAAFAEVVLTNWPENYEVLRTVLQNGGMKYREQIGRALLWYGDLSCADEILQQFITLDEKVGAACYHDRLPNGLIEGGIRLQLDDYWRINQCAVLLAKCNYRKALPAIAAAMDRTVLGGFYHPETPTYGSLRVDCQTNDNYDRMLCLAEAAMLMPDEMLVPSLLRLLSIVHNACVGSQNVYMRYLELRLAHAAVRCGSDQAAEIVKAFQEDDHGVLRNYAKSIEIW